MIFEFRDCRFDQETCELRRDGQVVALQPKVLDVLLYLLEHRDRVVPKNELLDRVWAGTAVGDGVLTRAINLARQAVGDAGRGQSVIRTLPRKGYRFCADVAVVEASGSGAVSEADRAYASGDWTRAIELFDAMETEAPLAPAALEKRSWALQWEARFDDATAEFERAAHAYEAAGDATGAARMALQLVREMALRTQTALAAGWMGRAIALLEGVEECEEHAHLEWHRARAQMLSGNLERAAEHDRLVIEIAQRCGSLDLEALGKLDLGHCLQGLGHDDEAVALHEEAASLAMAGRLGVQATGTIYCAVIWGSRNRGDWDRASQWTDLSIRWCENTRVAKFPGLCTMHRAEVLRLQGRFDEAEREALRACDDLLVSNKMVAGDAYNELGEIRLRRGDLKGARSAFRRAVELGMNPEPGLSRLRLEDGDIEGAAKGLERALADTGLNASERRVLQWCAKIEIALAADDLAAARAALAKLDAEPGRWQTAANRAEVEGCRGRIHQAAGELDAAIECLRGAQRDWLSVKASYEAARVQTWIARVLEADADPTGAALEWESARDTFERTGAQVDAARASKALSRLAAGRASAQPSDELERTFLFTDIVGSTQLVEVMGDADWETLRRWHHRTLQATFTEHGGEVVGPHEGDGFFVAFAQPDAAIECALAIQRALAAHREQHGFAPRVRIGAHTARAVRRGGDYAGKGVHVAARIAASAEGGSVRVSQATLDAARARHAAESTERLELKGTSEPVDIAVLVCH